MSTNNTNNIFTQSGNNQALSVLTINSDLAINTENIIYADASLNNIIITLPASPSSGDKINIIRMDNNPVNTLRVEANTGQTILQTGSYITLDNQHDSLVLVFDVDNWQVV